MADSTIETTLLIVREVQVYRLPPRATTRGYKAQEWEGGHVWTGRLKIVQRGAAECLIRLEDAQSGELFAQSMYRPEQNSVEPVIDSSRYFVLRVEDKGKHAFLGIGFQERNDAFDFNVALQDHVKHTKAMNEPKKPVDAGPKLDLGLREGQSININIGNLARSIKPSAANAATPAAPLGNFVIAPPPQAPASQFGGNVSFITPPTMASGGFTDDFGGFVSASAPNGSNSPSKPAGESTGWVKF
ncbi:hypothetical protein RI367_008336 [Sorochytrium milnesiophthora]